MKVKSSIIIIVILGVLMLGIASPVLAGRGCTGVDLEVTWVDVDKTAPGTKYNATLTIYYPASMTCPGIHDMHFFIRVEGNTIQAIKDYEGPEIFSFDAIEECIQYHVEGSLPPSQAYEMQRQAAEDFFVNVVNPGIYAWNNLDDLDGCIPDPSGQNQVCPDFAIKKISKVVEDQLNFQKFMIMDLIIAVDE